MASVCVRFDSEVTARVIDAFAAEPTGVARLDGKMIDIAHLKQARRVLGLAGVGEKRNMRE